MTLVWTNTWMKTFLLFMSLSSVAIVYVILRTSMFDLTNWNIVEDKMLPPILDAANLSPRYGYLGNFVPPEKTLTDKYIIYRCNSSRLCGGLADRQEGIVTAYLISQMLRRKFGLIMTKGCDFTRYVIPNEVDWMVSEETLTGKSVEVKRLIDNMNMRSQLRDGDLENIFHKDVIYYEGNIDYVSALMGKESLKSLKWTSNRTHHDIFRIAFAHLFKFTFITQQRYQDFLVKAENKSLLCAHLRMGKSKTIPRDDNLSHRRSNPEEVIKFLKKKIFSSTKLFIATDSDDVRTQMKNAFPENFVELEGKIVHIDRSDRLYDCSGLEKAIFAEFILSTCDTLVMSISGFSRLASYLRGTDEGLYLGGPKSITITKRVHPN